MHIATIGLIHDHFCDCVYVAHMYIRIYLHTGIDKVSGVTISCNPLDLIVQCTVVWNVRMYVHTYVYLSNFAYIYNCVFLAM